METLIVYATRYGSVREAAEMIARRLPGGAALYDLKKADVPPLDAYDAVILGGSIYIGRIQKELTDFMHRNGQTLLAKKLGLFICAGLPDAAAREKELMSVFPAALEEHASARGVLGYRMDFARMRTADRLIMRLIGGNSQNTCEYFTQEIGRFARAMDGMDRGPAGQDK